MGTNTKVICTKSKIEDIADAVRLRNNTQSTFTLDTLATAVNELNNKYTITFTRATPNATVTATKSGVSYSTTSDSNGSGSIAVYDYGTWVVTDVTTSKSTEVVFEKELPIIFSKIPSIYQEVEYIKSTGTQWIDTNFKPNQDTRVVIDYQDDDITVSTHGFIGSRDSVNSGFLIGGRSTYYWYTQYGNEQTPGTIFRNDNLRHFVDLNKTLLYYDNSLIHTFSSQIFSNQKSLTLFITNDFGSTNNAIGKIFQCQIYNNDILVRDFVPCYRKSDEVVGMYDTINNAFYTNLGTGTFIKGPNV